MGLIVVGLPVVIDRIPIVQVLERLGSKEVAKLFDAGAHFIDAATENLESIISLLLQFSDGRLGAGSVGHGNDRADTN